jgi:hypothetical protein
LIRGGVWPGPDGTTTNEQIGTFVARLAISVSGSDHSDIKAPVTNCNSNESCPYSPPQGGQKLWQKSHNPEQTDGLAQFKLVCAHDGRFSRASKFFIEGFGRCIQN